MSNQEKEGVRKRGERKRESRVDRGEGERRQSVLKGRTQSALIPQSPHCHDPLGDKREG